MPPVVFCKKVATRYLEYRRSSKGGAAGHLHSTNAGTTAFDFAAHRSVVARWHRQAAVKRAANSAKTWPKQRPNKPNERARAVWWGSHRGLSFGAVPA
jgi:membrane protease subunit (stomatin/prohibitin family)